MKAFKFSLVLRTCENTDVSISLDENIKVQMEPACWALCKF